MTLSPDRIKELRERATYAKSLGLYAGVAAPELGELLDAIDLAAQARLDTVDARSRDLNAKQLDLDRERARYQDLLKERNATVKYWLDETKTARAELADAKQVLHHAHHDRDKAQAELAAAKKGPTWAAYNALATKIDMLEGEKANAHRDRDAAKAEMERLKLDLAEAVRDRDVHRKIAKDAESAKAEAEREVKNLRAVEAKYVETREGCVRAGASIAPFSSPPGNGAVREVNQYGTTMYFWEACDPAKNRHCIAREDDVIKHEVKPALLFVVANAVEVKPDAKVIPFGNASQNAQWVANELNNGSPNTRWCWYFAKDHSSSLVVAKAADIMTADDIRAEFVKTKIELTEANRRLKTSAAHAKVIVDIAKQPAPQPEH